MTGGVCFLRNIVIGFIIIVMGFFLTLTVVKMSNTNSRELELQRTVTEAVEDTLTCDQNKKYTSNDAMIADFQTKLKKSLSSDGNVTVKILTADYKKGILDVSVTQEYGSGNQKKEITVRKSGIVNENKK
jgi:hypothetical protein